MRQQCNDPEAPGHTCSGWAEIVKCLEEFPSAEVTCDEGDVTKVAWVFRGLADSCFCLEPAIERQAHSKNMSWFALERLVAAEFKSRAHMRLNPSLVPQDEFTWLAQMQHYGIPTRLLDFTYSPFVALYFAAREQINVRNQGEKSHVRLWAINEEAVNDRFKSVVARAKAEANAEALRREGKVDRPRLLRMDPDDCYTEGDSVISETQGLQSRIAESLFATGTHRGELERQGCVAVASPPTFNPRLASQQGVFMINCAEELTFCDSLKKMMAGCRVEWCKRFDIAIDTDSNIEQRLFQMNIHEQSLFPDMEGLAGFIRQKLRLHWK